MNQACLRLAYPKYMCSEGELQWSQKTRYKVQQAIRGKEGAFMDKTVHVWRIPYASNVQLRYSAMIRHLDKKSTGMCQRHNSMPSSSHRSL